MMLRFSFFCVFRWIFSNFSSVVISTSAVLWNKAGYNQMKLTIIVPEIETVYCACYTGTVTSLLPLTVSRCCVGLRFVNPFLYRYVMTTMCVGHTMRKSSNSVTKQSLRRTPAGHRDGEWSRNRTLEKEVEKSKMTWTEMEKAQDHMVRHAVVSSLCSSRN